MKVFDPELDKQLGLLAAGGALAIETYHLEDRGQRGWCWWKLVDLGHETSLVCFPVVQEMS